MRSTMKAAMFESVGKLVVRNVPVPAIRELGDISCEVEQCSVCGMDFHVMSVPPDYNATPETVLGHQLAGRIVEVGTGVRSLKAGDRVVVNPNDDCGVCRYRRVNLPNEHENIIRVGVGADGGFAEQARMPERVACKVSNGLKPEIPASIDVICKGGTRMLLFGINAKAAPPSALPASRQRRRSSSGHGWRTPRSPAPWISWRKACLILRPWSRTSCPWR
jgi:D-arabinose 1-dehydrogenase-like Zn-dependent alcohol dehydrogenase